MEMDKDEREALLDLHLLTNKPFVYAVTVEEASELLQGDSSTDQAHQARLREIT